MESIGRLAGGIAHDFNNILGIIIGDTELLLEKCSQENISQTNLKRILTASHRARDMVKQILTFSRKDEDVHEQIQLGEVIQDALQLMRSVLPSTIQIYPHIEENLGSLKANQTEIHQVIINLCINAGHAMREKGGELSVSLKQVRLADDQGICNLAPGLYQQLTVSDTGHGMTPDILQHIFEPYFTTKKAGEGSGMGLAVVHGIVSAYGGEIAVHSEVGKGTSFNVFLPVENDVQKKVEKIAAVSTAPASTQGQGEKILLVDDEANLAEMAKEMLESYGYSVDTRIDSLEALEVFRENPDKYNLVISDQTMPNLTGVHLAEKIRRIRSDIPIIVCSGYSDSIDEDSYASYGINAFVMKPFAGKDLARAVRQVLEK
jgi:CheY-like chemotaxis protein